VEFYVIAFLHALKAKLEEKIAGILRSYKFCTIDTFTVIVIVTTIIIQGQLNGSAYATRLLMTKNEGKF
jgi:hypothetical protein